MKEVTDERLLSRIRRIKLLILDVDGVMTDGRIIIDDAGLESKQFDVRDGHGLKILMRYGIDVALLTACANGTWYPGPSGIFWRGAMRFRATPRSRYSGSRSAWKCRRQRH